MNGHAQSGGHWNAAFGLLARTSDNVGSPQWSSRSGDGSANGILYIMDMAPSLKSVAQRLWLRHQRNRRAMRGLHPLLTLHLQFVRLYSLHLWAVCSRLHIISTCFTFAQRESGVGWNWQCTCPRWQKGSDSLNLAP